MKAENSGSDSCHWSLDQGKITVAGPNQYGKWQQIRLGEFKLAAGEHTLRFWVREGGLMLSRITIDPEPLKPAVADFKSYPPPPILPPAGHPRVLLRAADLPTIRQRLTQPESLPFIKRVRELAARKITGELPDKPISQYGCYDEGILRVIEAKAFIYLLEGRKDLGKEAIAMMKNNFRTASFTDYLDVTRPIGYTIFVGALVYDWCYPLLTADDKKYFIAQMEKLAATMEIGYPPVHQSDITSHAGEAQLLRDLLAAGIAVYDERPEMYLVSAGRLFDRMVPARNFFYVSGRHHQGDSYGPYRFQWDVFAAWLFERMSHKKIFSTDMAKVPYSWLYARTPDGELIRDGDSFTSGGYWKQPMPVFLSYTFFKDPILKGEFIRQNGPKWALGDPVFFLLLNDPALPVKSLNDLPLTRFFPEPLGAMICRTGWEFGRTANVVVAEMKGAGYQFNNHHHLDAGGFQIYYRGMLAADLGLYSKYGTPYDWSFNKRSIAHNVMLVYDPAEKFASGGEKFGNDGGQRLPNSANEPAYLKVLLEKGYHNGTVPAHAFGPDASRPLFSYLKTDLKAAYSNKISDYVRSFCFLNLGRADIPAVMVVFDRMTTARPELKKYWQLNSYQEPAIAANTVTIVRDTRGYDGKLLCTTLLPAIDQLEIRKIGGPGKTGNVFGKTYSIASPFPAATGWRTTISPVKPAATDLFLNVLQVSAAGQKAMLQPELLRNDKIVGVKVADRIVTFAVDGRLLNGNIVIPDHGGGKQQMQVLVTDLSPGWWTVRRNGTTLGKAEVKVGNHTLFFTAEPGKYELQHSAGNDTAVAPLPSYDRLRAEATQPDKISLNIAGREIVLSRPLPENDHCKLVPAGKVLNAAGATQKIAGDRLETTLDGRRAVFQLGSRQFLVNDLQIEMETAPCRIDGEWYLPANALSRFLRLSYFSDEIGGGISMTVPTSEMRRSVWAENVSGGPNSEQSPFNVVDGDRSTYWAAHGQEAWLKLALERSARVGAIAVTWYNGNRRQYRFEVLTSTDGKNWTPAFAGSSSGKTSDPETYRFDRPREAHLVMLKGSGNSENQWNSIVEVAILPE